MHSPSWGGEAAYIARLLSWRRDHSSHSGGDSAHPFFEQPSSLFLDVRRPGLSCILCHPRNRVLLTHLICCTRNVTGRSWTNLHPARPKIIAVLLETLMAILQTLKKRWRSFRHDYTDNNADLLEAAMMVVSSAFSVKSTLRGKGHVFNKDTEDDRISPPLGNLAHMPWRDDAAIRKTLRKTVTWGTLRLMD